MEVTVAKVQDSVLESKEPSIWCMKKQKRIQRSTH